jgi:large subunit ribosomal protein L16
MGAGKGAVEYWVAVIRPGTILFELAGVTYDLAQSAMKLAAYKLPIKTKFIKKSNTI